MTLEYGNYGIFLIMGNAGFISSAVGFRGFRVLAVGVWFRGLGFRVDTESPCLGPKPKLTNLN